MLSKQRLKSVLLSGNSQEEKRAEIKKNFLQTYELYEKLFECIKNDKAYFKKSNRLRHPLIFYYAHTAVFFVNKLMLLGVLKKPLNQHIEATCAIGVDEMSWDDLDEKNYNWPSISDVKKYRDDVKNIVLELIETLPLSLPISWNSEFWIILMGIEHEKIHFETSSVLIRELPIADVQTHKDFTICKQDSISPKNEMITIEKSKITLGKEKDSTLYGWDNEYGVHEVDIDEFQASKFLVSNKEFLEFVEAKGYENINYWSDEGWKWREFTSAVHPVFWQKNNVNSEYQLRTMLELVPMMWSWPADVNCHEAEAFCKYKSEQTNQNI
ncbi:MAG: Glutamate synthase [NADPH] large chain (EC, partial [uncultured Campylobacterales bacterium]